MKAQDIDKLSEQKAKSILKDFYNSPYCDIYFSIKSQISKLSKEIENTDIDFKEDSAPFKNFIIWGKESMNLTNNLENILAKIDTTILREQEKQRVSAKEGSLESYISKK
jgi:hypothetical protein